MNKRSSRELTRTNEQEIESCADESYRDRIMDIQEFMINVAAIF